MSYNRPHRIAKDIQNCKINTSKDNTNKNFVSRSVRNSFSNEQKYCNDLDTSSSTLVTDLYAGLSNKQRNTHSSGSVNKRPLRRSVVRSNTNLEYGGSGDYNVVLIKPDRRTQINRRGSYIYEGDDIDYIPVKLSSSDAATYDKMKSSRASKTLLKPDNKPVNSWGKILKEHNVKETNIVKKPIGILQTSKTKPIPKPVIKQQALIKEKRVGYDQPTPVSPPSNRIKLSTPNSVDSSTSSKAVSSKRARSKSRSRNLLDHEPIYSDSATTITGESIMLIDRSAQCSTTNMAESGIGKWKQRSMDFNQAGDNGLAYFNPVRTLNFLVRELRGKLSEGAEDENMARIIHDMENTIGRLSSNNQHSQQAMDSWNTLISEEDLKYVLELLQSPPIPKSPVSNQVLEEKGASELQTKLEETCEKLETMCMQMEQVTCSKLREEKEVLFSKLSERNKEFEELTNKVSQHEHFIKDLKKKTDEQAKIINALKDTNNRATALNKILNEQLEDTEKKYQELVTEMQFLMLEKEKNIVLMRCKDQDLIEMRKNLEEIKTLVIDHLTSINVQTTDSTTKVQTDNKSDFDNLSAISLTGLKRTDSSVPKGNDPPQQLLEKVSSTPIQASGSDRSIANKAIGIKASIKNILEEMKQTHLRTNLSVQNLINLEDQTGISNWSDMDVSDDEQLQSPSGYHVSDTDTNF